MPPKSAKTDSAGDRVAQISNLPDDASRRKFFAGHAGLQDADFIRKLIDAVVAQGRVETHRALALAEAAVFLSAGLRNQEILGLSLRAKANALYLGGQNRQALEFYDKSLEIFVALKTEEEIARTLSASLQAMILLGEYDPAFAAAGRAREIFTRLGETRRLARLDNNVGNIYHRQDRFEEALACYERCYDQLLPYGDSQELVTALSNMAVCLISLNDFPRALATYERARDYCDATNNMPLLRSQADYNIAYLYYLRGEYSRGIQMLQEARRQCEATGDNYHLALCHLDLSEIYLELNLSSDARDMAHEGSLRFQKLGMGYEEAKCTAYEAMALSQLSKAVQALDLFSQSRAVFVRENNRVWPWLIDLYQSVVLCNEGRLFEARRLCARAATFFDTSLLPGKAALCQLLLARISVRTGDLAAARQECARALERLRSIDAPVLAYQAHFLMGQTEQLSGNLSQAYVSFQKAREALEALRSSLHGEELKIAFMKNRLEVYESLVELCLGDKERPDAAEESFGYMEMAKSRSLAELLVHHEQAIPSREAGQSGLVRRIRDMREELNWYYRRIELEQLRAEEPSPERIEKLQKQARDHENELLRALREVPQTSAAGPRDAGGAAAANPLETLRACLPAQAALVEYYVVKDQFVAAVATGESLEIVPVTPVSRVVSLLRLLHFQISKFRLGADYVRSFEKSLMDATQSHLGELYEELVAPLRAHLDGRHLIIVPHGVLHYLPFHALYDGEKYLIDSFTISYAPSATIFAVCQQKPSLSPGPSLILGIPDAQAPQILDEVNSVAKILPGAELLLGPDASEQALRDKGLHSRLIHIATHGNFRQDNPMFSGIRLGTNYFSLYDLYQLKLNAELVTLSGCATGLNVVTAGDELLGLIRGLLYAGAHTVLLTLWDVHDRSTAELMSSFYSRLQEGQGNAAALQGAMRHLRSRYPHPYYWAPFTLIGKVSAV